MLVPLPLLVPLPSSSSTPSSSSAALQPQTKQSDSFTRTYETGKEISVTRAVPGNVRRLSVAVLLREESGKPRGIAEITLQTFC